MKQTCAAARRHTVTLVEPSLEESLDVDLLEARRHVSTCLNCQEELKHVADLIEVARHALATPHSGHHEGFEEMLAKGRVDYLERNTSGNLERIRSGNTADPILMLLPQLSAMNQSDRLALFERASLTVASNYNMPDQMLLPGVWLAARAEASSDYGQRIVENDQVANRHDQTYPAKIEDALDLVDLALALDRDIEAAIAPTPRRPDDSIRLAFERQTELFLAERG